MDLKTVALNRRTATIVVGVVAALVAVLALGLGARAALDDGTDTSADGTMGAGDDNVAVANNTRDGSEVYAVRLKVVQTNGPTVDSGNAAVAAASCENCTTVAVAIEGVLVFGDNIDTVTPVNIAIALNTECTNCQTLAATYQYVTQNDSRVRITGEGRQTIAMLRQELNKLPQSDLTFEEVIATVDRIAGEFYAVLLNEVVPIGKVEGEFPTEGAVPSPDFRDDQAPTPTSEATETTPTSGATETTPTSEPTETTSTPTSEPTETTATPTETPTEEESTSPSPSSSG